ncbi:MAG: site-specific DNA-methyltransferase [Candidatus Micrarchaeaceae archaeon]
MEDIILHGDVYSCLEQVKDNSIAVVITSPPYWKQRDYGFAGQIGQEDKPEAYIGRLVAVFNKLKQKLRDDGVFFLNVGDKYLGQYGKSHLLQIPYRLAYHMVKNGWYLEDIIIWYKPNHMPSSVKDRFTNTYEPVLILAKSKDNIYHKGLGNIVKIPLQQTPWKHTAVFPEALVEEMMNRVDLKDYDIILDPFAGTGTVASVVIKRRGSLFPQKIFSIMIEKGDLFIDIIQNRTGIKNVKRVDSIHYTWKPVVEERIPENIESYEVTTNKYGEVFIAQNSDEFISALKGINSKKFKEFHREDAIYFFGVKEWSIEDLYYIAQISREGYVLRNMLVVSKNKKWYPIFMFAKDSTIVAYKFYIDRIRIKPKTKEKRDWSKENFIGIRVKDISGKKVNEGWIVKIVEKYSDGFPKIVVVQWNGYASIEFVLHPENDENIMEGLLFKCPHCKYDLEEPYDPAIENTCPSCGGYLWKNSETIPLIEEPQEVKNVIDTLKYTSYFIGETLQIEKFEERKKTASKFAELERINWGASPGARKLMLGEYFTKMRLYRIDQPIVAQVLTLLRKKQRFSTQDIVNRFPKEYKHTVGHWFRKDFGGSIPIPEDIKLLRRTLNLENKILDILERTALKFQTVKISIKGKNPEDFFDDMDEDDLTMYLKKTFLPSREYIKIKGK